MVKSAGVEKRWLERSEGGLAYILGDTAGFPSLVKAGRGLFKGKVRE